jgi:hypothetical protein
MARIGITYQDVTVAIAELQGKQRNVTCDNIRELLGTGSKSTIARFLREWKEKHGLQRDDDASVPSELIGMVKGLWLRMQDKMHIQAIEHETKANEKTDAMQQEVSASKRQQENLQVQIHELQEKLHQQSLVNQQLTGVL